MKTVSPLRAMSGGGKTLKELSSPEVPDVPSSNRVAFSGLPVSSFENSIAMGPQSRGLPMNAIYYKSYTISIAGSKKYYSSSMNGTFSQATRNGVVSHGLINLKFTVIDSRIWVAVVISPVIETE